MTTVLPHRLTSGRHRAPETSDEPGWATPADFAAAWARAPRHAASEPDGQHAAGPDGRPATAQRRDDDLFDWLSSPRGTAG